jgi:membrane protein DedA with SNARE-associated domain
MSKLDFLKTLSLSAVSALVWNGILVFLGMKLGEHWRVIGDYLSTYGQIIGSIIGIIALVFGIRWFLKRRAKEKKTE